MDKKKSKRRMPKLEFNGYDDGRDVICLGVDDSPETPPPDLHAEQFLEITERRDFRDQPLPTVPAPAPAPKTYIANDGVYEQKFEVEAVRDYACFKDGFKYFVKWRGWDEKDNTWEPAKHLGDCEEVLLQFYLQRRHEYYVRRRDTKYVKKPKLEPFAKDPHLVISERVTSLLPPDPRSFREICKEFTKYFKFTSRDLLNGVVEFGTTFRKPEVNLPQLSTMVGKAIYNQGTPSTIKYIRDTILRIEIWKRAGDLQISLKKWQNELNLRSEGKPTICVENKVDLEYPPVYFSYFNLSEHISPVPETKRSSGCSCKTTCFERKYCCGAAYGSEFAYNRSGRLVVPPGTPVFECNDNCDCDHECPNRVVQDGFKCLERMQYCIFRTPDKGWGVKTLKGIKKGTFTMLLVGEIITSEEACRRHLSPDEEAGKYFFDLEFYGDSSYVIDYSCKGNISHFVNHSCNPNQVVHCNWYNSSDPLLPRVALYAAVDIPANTELTYSYVNVENFRSRYRLELEGGGVPEGFSKCYCESTNCVKFMIFPN